MGEVERRNFNRLAKPHGRSLSAASRADKRKSRIALMAAFGAVYLVWGSTYLGIKYAIETIPPLLMAGSRFLLAGALLYGWAWLRGADNYDESKSPSRAHWRTAVGVGALLFLGGNGGVTWAEGRITSSMAALLVATEPLWIVLMGWVRPHGERPGGKVMLGLLVGFAGVWLLISPARSDNSGVNMLGACAVIAAAFSWAAGSLYSLHAPQQPHSPLLASGMQMLAGGVLLTLAGILTGEWPHLALGNVSARSVLALLYLVIFGSVVAFTAYSWLLHAVRPERAATYAYVNPVVACALGWAIGGEAMTLRTSFAAAVIVASVMLITAHGKKSRAKPTISADDKATCDVAAEVTV